ncbi:hypothetical protein H0H87_000899 [Tephrocybe sp. NHM501043]|nr:hypothetical protein H0H87_000899 [Tephrocybe sp. NHM501043]
MAGLSKITIERNQKLLMDLVAQPGNGKLSIFVQIARKSLTMDSWTKEQVEPMKSIGNIRSNAIYNPNEIRNPPPPNLMDAERDSELEQYIRSKYQFKRFLDKSAFAASKLGPSRSSASLNGSSLLTGSSRGSSAPLTSAVSSPSVSTFPPQMPTRQSTLMTEHPARPPAKAVPQPMPTSQYPRQPAAPPQSNGAPSSSRNGVWEDLVSLQGTSSSSSLPLQFQAPLQTPLSGQGYQTSMVTGINPFQQQHLASNPYSQQQFPSAGFRNSSFAVETQFPPSNFSGSQQSYFPTQQPLMSAPAVQAQNNSNFFQPQPQQALQIQVPSAGQAMFTSGNGQGGSSFMSAPPTHGHFLSTSPAQYPSQSPQPVSSMTPQPQMYSTTPQPQMFSTTPQPQQMMAQYTSTPSQQFQIQQQGGLGVSSLQQNQGHLPSQMAMGQQQFYGGVGQPQSMGQVIGGYQQASQPFSATRAAAAAAATAAAVVVSPSATGKGTHNRWRYIQSEDAYPSPSPSPLNSRTATKLFTEASMSSISTHSSSSEDASLPTPTGSFVTHTLEPVTPQRNQTPLTTPPRLSPKKLQRSPARCRWITQDGVTRVIFSEESTEDATFRDIQTNIKLNHIAERELEILLREREKARAHESLDAFGMDLDTEASESWCDQVSTADLSEMEMDGVETQVTSVMDSDSGLGLAPSAYIRGDTEPTENVPSMPVQSFQRQARPLGPEGTELIDPHTFRPYSMESFGDSSKVETWRQRLC